MDNNSRPRLPLEPWPRLGVSLAVLRDVLTTARQQLGSEDEPSSAEVLQGYILPETEAEACSYVQHLWSSQQRTLGGFTEQEITIGLASVCVSHVAPCFPKLAGPDACCCFRGRRPLQKGVLGPC